MMSRPKLISMVILACLTLGGCGIKPGQLTPPQGEEKDSFPHVYPYDPSRDKSLKK